MRLKKNNFVFLIITFVFVGCATHTLQTQSLMTKTVILRPSEHNKTVHVTYKNTALSHIDIKSQFEMLLKKKGFSIVDEYDKAFYKLHINILFATNIKEAYAIKNSTQAGAVGAVTGAAIKGSLKDGLLVGALAAIGTMGVSKALEDEIYRAVVDVNIKDNHQDHKTRILVEARQMTLDDSVALPVLEKKVARQIAEIF